MTESSFDPGMMPDDESMADLLGHDPDARTNGTETDPLLVLERAVQFKARLFVMVCMLCAMVSLILLMLRVWPFEY
jgi:hypothetical protein